MTARPLLHALPTPSALERIASIQSEIASVLADETYSLIGHLKISLVHAQNLADCPATEPGMRDLARQAIPALRKHIGFLEQNIARA